MINTQTLKGNLINQDYSIAFTLSQGDKGVPFRVELLENGTPYTLLSDDIVTIEWLKPNGNPFLQEGNIKYGTNYIEFTTPESVAQYSGSGTFNIIITNNNVRKGTIRREYKVVPTSMKPGLISEDVITDAITELRELNSTLAATIQTGNLDNYAKKTYVNKEVELINSSLEENANELQTQINNLVIGSGTSSAEVVQARVLDGFTFPTLKSGLDSIMSMLKTTSYNCYYTCTIGDITNGADVESSTRLRSGFVVNNSTQKEYFRVQSGYKYKIVYYNKDKEYQIEEDWRDYNAELQRDYSYYRVTIARTDDSELNLDEYINVYTIRNFDIFNNLNKTVLEFISNYNKGKIKTVKDYGAIGDGSTDDSQSIQDAINNCGESELLYFPYATYIIDTPLEINKSIKINLCGSTIKSRYDIGTLIKIKALDTNLIQDLSIEHGKIDLNLVSYIGLSIKDCAHFSINNLIIVGFKKNGILIDRDGLTNQCYEGFFDDIRLIGPYTEADSNTVGIYNNTADCHFNNIVGKGGMAALIVNAYEANYYTKVHGWYDYPQNRCLIKTYNECFITQCYSDSLPIGVLVTGVNGLAKVTQCRFLYPSKNENSEEYYAIKFDDTVSEVQETSVIQCRFYGNGNNEYNFDSNKNITIEHCTYTNVNKKFV